MSITYIVTGASGHLGGSIVNSLLSKGNTVRALILPCESNVPEIELGNEEGDLRVYEGDVCDPDSLDPLFVDKSSSKDDIVVFHCAGIVSIASKFEQKVWDVNVAGTQNIVDLCQKYKVRRLVYISSVHAIPVLPQDEVMTEIESFDPEEVEGVYAKTKSVATQIVLDAAKSGLDAVVVHPSGIIGPNDRLGGHTSQLVADYIDGRLTAIVKGGYDFTDVRDVAEGAIMAAEKGESGECYILSNRYIDLKELFETLANICGRKPIRTILPMWFAKITAPLAELYYKILHQPPLYTRYSLYTLSENAKFSHKKATEKLGYKTRELKETLKDTIAWLKTQGKIKNKLKGLA